jgi:hypothetical protein
MAVILNAADGKVITALPIGNGVDGGEFNPATMEAFSSEGGQRGAGGSGTLTVIKENSPTDFVLEQTVKTPSGAKCSTLDAATNHILLIANTPAPAGTAPAAPPATTGGRGNGGIFSVIVVGR